MFEYTITDEASVKCISPKGRVDALTSQDIQKAFDRLILDGERLLLVDMGGVNYISSAGLRVFLSTQKQLKKVGGEIVLAAMTRPVQEVFELSGLTTVFQTLAAKEEIRKVLSKDSAGDSFTAVDVKGMHIEYVERGSGKSPLVAIGSQEKNAASSYTEDDVVPVKAAEVQFGCGFAALGDLYEEYKDLLGESMVVDGSFFFFPAIRHSSVDFLIGAGRESGTVYRFFHGFGFNGPYRYLLSFEAVDRLVDLASLTEGFLDIFRSDILGIVIVAESKGVWGMHVKKVPLLEQKPQNGKSIFDAENFAEWVDFPVEPAYADHVVVATGIVVRDPPAMKPEMRSLVAESSKFHVHGGIFEKAPLSKDIGSFDGELLRIFNELQVHKVQHLLGRSTFSGGMAAVIGLEA